MTLCVSVSVFSVLCKLWEQAGLVKGLMLQCYRGFLYHAIFRFLCNFESPQKDLILIKAKDYWVKKACWVAALTFLCLVNQGLSGYSVIRISIVLTEQIGVFLDDVWCVLSRTRMMHCILGWLYTNKYPSFNLHLFSYIVARTKSMRSEDRQMNKNRVLNLLQPIILEIFESDCSFLLLPRWITVERFVVTSRQISALMNPHPFHYLPMNSGSVPLMSFMSLTTAEPMQHQYLLAASNLSCREYTPWTGCHTVNTHTLICTLSLHTHVTVPAFISLSHTLNVQAICIFAALTI